MVSTEQALLVVVILGLLIVLLSYLASRRGDDPNAGRNIVGAYSNWADWGGPDGKENTLRGAKDVRTVKGKGSTRPVRKDEDKKSAADD